MPTLPLPLDMTGLSGGDLPVVTDDDVEQVLRSFLKKDDPTLVRDALVSGLFKILATYQQRAERACALSDVLRSEGEFLRGIAQDAKIPIFAGDSDDAIRARILVSAQTVTPTAILAAANTILAPFTTIKAAYCEGSDRWFVADRSQPNPPGWFSFVWTSAMNRDPSYPDRLYVDDAVQNGGAVIPRRRPGGARAFTDTFGRQFLLRIPDLTAAASSGFFPFSIFSTVPGLPSTPSSPDTDYRVLAVFAGTGISTFDAQLANSVRSIPGSALTVFNAIVSTVQRIKGHGVRWTIVADPKLID